MKVKVISRNPDHYLRDTKSDIFKGKFVEDPRLIRLTISSQYCALNLFKQSSFIYCTKGHLFILLNSSPSIEVDKVIIIVHAVRVR